LLATSQLILRAGVVYANEKGLATQSLMASVKCWVELLLVLHLKLLRRLL
jgi:hypothetical protein